MYIAAGQGQTTLGDKILMSTETSRHFGHLLQVLKNTFIFSWFYTCTEYSPGAVADIPLGTNVWCQQEHLVTSVICCKFQKNNLVEVWFYTFFFMILYMYVYSPRAGADRPQGAKFWCQQKLLVTSSICCKFQKKKFFEVWFYKNKFSWFNTCL